jgi:hypothetical protein
MNLSAYPRERRRAMSGDTLASMFGMRGVGAVTPDEIVLVGDWFEGLDELEAVGLLTDASQIAGDLDASPEMRRLAACVSCVCESVLTAPFISWDALAGLADASRAVRKPDVKGRAI